MPDHQRQQLLARIGKRFDIVTRDLTIGRLIIPFTQIKDPDTVLDAIVAEADRREKISGRRQHDDELHLPYWAELWDSAMGIAEHLCAQHSPRGTKHSTLDLGCGMGLAGTAAAALGHSVMFADIETEALLFARLNAMQFDKNIRARRVDWRRDHLRETFDLILGADVLYDKANWDPLDVFWRDHLASGGSILLGEPGRQSGEMFLEWLNAREFWKLERMEQPIATRSNPIRLFRLFR